MQHRNHCVSDDGCSDAYGGSYSEPQGLWGLALGLHDVRQIENSAVQLYSVYLHYLPLTVKHALDPGANQWQRK